VRRGGLTILHDVSLSGQGGDFIGMIGANGAGKSTLLSVLAGLRTPHRGTVEYNGENVRHMAPSTVARIRAFLPQNPRCEWPITVERLVALGLTPTLPAVGGLPDTFEAAIHRVLDECDLAHKREQPVTTLSGGELARAMLARALVSDPDILMVDEPIAGLDPRHAMDALHRLRDLARAGKLVIASIHDLTFAARYPNRIVALDQGGVKADGATETALTSDLLREVFGIEACIAGTPGAAYVDFVEPVRK
jgi:iron complex transport system ATP-binding protein